MNNKNYIVGIGETLWDVFPEGKKLGGAPANFAFHVAQLGLDGIAVSAIGYDNLGSEIVDSLKSKSLDFYMQPVGYPTGTVQVTVDDRGVPQYTITEGVAWDNLELTPELEAIAADTQAVCFGSLAQRSERSRSTIRSFIAATKADSLRVFDINLRQHFYSKEIITESLQISNILKINDEELEIVTPLLSIAPGSQESRCKELLAAYGLRTLILTCGTDGSHIFTADGLHSFLPTPAVSVVDTVGAGDSFTAAFIAGIIKGEPVERAHKEAVELSAFVCTQEGAMPSHRR